jgi:hypothetical protein
MLERTRCDDDASKRASERLAGSCRRAGSEIGAGSDGGGSEDGDVSRRRKR